MKKLDAFMLEDLLEFTLCNQSVDIAVSRYIKDKTRFYQYDTYMCSMCICYRRYKNLKDHIEQVRAAYVPPMRALFASTKGYLLATMKKNMILLKTWTPLMIMLPFHILQNHFWL